MVKEWTPGPSSSPRWTVIARRTLVQIALMYSIALYCTVWQWRVIARRKAWLKCSLCIIALTSLHCALLVFSYIIHLSGQRFMWIIIHLSDQRGWPWSSSPWTLGLSPSLPCQRGASLSFSYLPWSWAEIWGFFYSNCQVCGHPRHHPARVHDARWKGFYINLFYNLPAGKVFYINFICQIYLCNIL